MSVSQTQNIPSKNREHANRGRWIRGSTLERTFPQIFIDPLFTVLYHNKPPKINLYCEHIACAYACTHACAFERHFACFQSYPHPQQHSLLNKTSVTIEHSQEEKLCLGLGQTGRGVWPELAHNSGDWAVWFSCVSFICVHCCRGHRQPVNVAASQNNSLGLLSTSRQRFSTSTAQGGRDRVER